MNDPTLDGNLSAGVADRWNSFLACRLSFITIRLRDKTDRWWVRNLPNMITCARLPLMLGLAYLLYFTAGSLPLTLGVILLIGLAMVSDGIDGTLARELHIESSWGAAADGAVDKLSFLALLVAVFGRIVPHIPTEDQQLVGLMTVPITIIIVFELSTAWLNKSRQALCDQLGIKFESRPPAKIKFVAEILLLVVCCLLPTGRVAGLGLTFSLIIIGALTMVSCMDYSRDKELLQRKLEQTSLM